MKYQLLFRKAVRHTCFSFPRNFPRKSFLSDVHRVMDLALHVKCRLLLSNFNRSYNMLKDLCKNSPESSIKKIRIVIFFSYMGTDGGTR
jgi:hypothetical protein